MTGRIARWAARRRASDREKDFGCCHRRGGEWRAGPAPLRPATAPDGPRAGAPR